MSPEEFVVLEQKKMNSRAMGLSRSKYYLKVTYSYATYLVQKKKNDGTQYMSLCVSFYTKTFLFRVLHFWVLISLGERDCFFFFFFPFLPTTITTKLYSRQKNLFIS